MYKFGLESKKLSNREVNYWIKVFSKNLLIGTEMETEFENSVSVRDFDYLNLEGGFKNFGKGIEGVKSDGSLRRGVEILTPGRMVYGMLEQYSMYQNVLNEIEEFNPVIKPNASWHNHIVLDYLGINKAEQKIPGIIFRNVMQLLKMFVPSLCYISSTLPEEEFGAITRYDEYCRLQSLHSCDFIEDSLRDIFNSLDSRYNAINLNRMQSYYRNDDDTLLRFHIEFRFPDQSIFPTQQASLNILWVAIIMKAIRLSQFGVIDISEEEEKYDLYKLYDFKNGYDNTELDACVADYHDNDDDNRTSCMLTPEYLEKMNALSSHMIDFFESDILTIDKLALPVLKDLSTCPVSVRSGIEGFEHWSDINIYLDNMLSRNIESFDLSLEPLSKIITLGEVKGLSKTDWFEKVGTMIAGTEPLQDMIARLGRTHKMKFSVQSGYYYEI